MLGIVFYFFHIPFLIFLQSEFHYKGLMICKQFLYLFYNNFGKANDFYDLANLGSTEEPKYLVGLAESYFALGRIKFAKNNKKLFVLCCGADYLSVKYAYEKKVRYSILSPLFDGKVSRKAFEDCSSINIGPHLTPFTITFTV